MASIVERNNSVSVVYYYQDEDGNKKQKWETVKKDQLDRSKIEAATGKRVKEKTRTAKRAAAGCRKAEVEYTQNKGTFIIPKKTTVKDFLSDFVSLYGERKWGVSAYVQGRNRGTERIIIGNDGSAWYTKDHYGSFVRIK